MSLIPRDPRRLDREDAARAERELLLAQSEEGRTAVLAAVTNGLAANPVVAGMAAAVRRRMAADAMGDMSWPMTVERGKKKRKKATKSTGVGDGATGGSGPQVGNPIMPADGAGPRASAGNALEARIAQRLGHHPQTMRDLTPDEVDAFWSLTPENREHVFAPAIVAKRTAGEMVRNLRLRQRGSRYLDTIHRDVGVIIRREIR